MVFDKIHRYRFTDEEDKRLKALVRKLGPGCWNEIAAHMHHRTPRQCRDRWNHYISPHADNSEWKESEDALIIQQLKTYGKQWTKIARHLPGRTAVAVRNRSCKLARRSGTDREIKELLKNEYIRKADRCNEETVFDCIPEPKQISEKPLLPPCYELMEIMNIPITDPLAKELGFNASMVLV